ncbi:MAG: glycosyltransferase family 39 protein [Tepidisphaeraceae bacterium]
MNEKRKSGNRWAFLMCAALLLVFAVTGRLAWLSKSPTFDEPVHLVSARAQTAYSDFRIDPEDPPLWKYFAVAGASGDLPIDQHSELFASVLTQPRDGEFSFQTLYRSPSGRMDVDGLLNSARARMIFLALVLGVLIGWWAWRLAGGLAGRLAAVVAVAAFAFDPNFLAHAPLLKNDAPIALIFLGLAASIGLLGERVTIWRWLACCVLVSAALTTKFSGLIALPIFAIALLARAILPQPWPFLKRILNTRSRRISAAVILFAGCLPIAYLSIWACYGFRFAPAADGSLFDVNLFKTAALQREASIAHGSPPDVPMDQLNQWAGEVRPSLTVRSVQWANDHHVLPQAWLMGFLYTYGTSLQRPTFLCGTLSLRGWWYYFPLAMAFKTPLTTLAAIALAAILSPMLWKMTKRADLWPFVAVAVCPVIYMFVAMRSHLDIGMRHVLPVYPFLFIFLGVSAARAWNRWPRATIICIAVFIAGLATETFSAYPNFIPFFNVAAGGSRGGLRLLSDSNIDWGQELPDLANWQTSHRDRPLYLCYFGFADPGYYGIQFTDMEHSGILDHLDRAGQAHAVFAISAVALQGAYMDAQRSARFAPFRRSQPFDVLGGSIYLFDAPENASP